MWQIALLVVEGCQEATSSFSGILCDWQYPVNSSNYRVTRKQLCTVQVLHIPFSCTPHEATCLPRRWGRWLFDTGSWWVGDMRSTIVQDHPSTPNCKDPPPHPNCKIFVDVQCISEAIRDYILADAGHMPACSVAMFAIQVQLQR